MGGAAGFSRVRPVRCSRDWLAPAHSSSFWLHRAAVELVKAPAQAERAERILPLLTEEEAAVYKRGRNAHVRLETEKEVIICRF